MGDYFERIVDVEVTCEEAGPLAERMVDWMVAEGLITRELSGDGVFSHPVTEGYVRGPNWARAVADSSNPHWLPGPVAVIVGRNYYVGGQGADEATYAVCPQCRHKTVIINYPEEFERDEEVWQPFKDGIAAWKATGEGVPLLQLRRLCPAHAVALGSRIRRGRPCLRLLGLAGALRQFLRDVQAAAGAPHCGARGQGLTYVPALPPASGARFKPGRSQTEMKPVLREVAAQRVA
ncbi:hypothetical protein NKH77_51865 [Streptomyces sp. M19]